MITKLAEKTANALSFTEEATTKWNDRLVGSPDCLACGDFLEQSFRKFCDTTQKHTFFVRPGAFLGFIDFGVVFYFLTLAALWMQYLAMAVLLATIPILITVFQFFFYKDFISFLYPKKQGQNIVGFIEPTGEMKQQIIVSAHHDSAHIFNFLDKAPETFPKKMLIANGATFGIAIITWGLWIAGLLGFQSSMATYLAAGFFTLLSYNVGQMWFFYDKKGTPGAGDNLICTAIAMEVGKYFSAKKIEGTGLKHTRVVVASWDAEECGLRGARAYVGAHLPQLKSVPTYNFNLECMYDVRQLGFLTSDLNSFVPLSEEMVDDCLAVSQHLGYSVKKVPFPFLAGGTDAAEFAKVGIEATTLAGMSWVDKQGKPAYHTPRDTIEAVDDKAVAASIHIAIEYVLKKERAYD
ncbi:MAG: M28 family peptidase [Bacteroidota bacterium]